MKIRLLSLPPILMLGVMTGFFYAFSVSVLPGLDRISTLGAIEAMQGINIAVRNPLFFVSFFLTPVIALGCATALWMSGDKGGASLTFLATMVYLGGVIAPTALLNVPMNNALALVEPGAEGIAMLWSDYSERWTLWNNLRTAVNLTAFAIAAFAPVVTLR